MSRYDDHQYHGQIGSEKSSEVRGRFVGFAWDVGHALTFKVLTDDSKRVLCRSRIRLCKDGENNLKLDELERTQTTKEYVHSKRDDNTEVRLPTLNDFDNPFDVDESELMLQQNDTLKIL